MDQPIGVNVKEYLPYRGPMLLVDSVRNWNFLEIVVEKLVHPDDVNVAGHLVGSPSIFPGVLLIEMVGQAALLHSRLKDVRDERVMVLGRCKAKFFLPVLGGDLVTAIVNEVGRGAGGSIHKGIVKLGNRVAAEVEVAAKAVSFNSALVAE